MSIGEAELPVAAEQAVADVCGVVFAYPRSRYPVAGAECAAEAAPRPGGAWMVASVRSGPTVVR